MVRIVGCIPKSKGSMKSKLSEIEELITCSNADILFLPEEFFGGPTPTRDLETYSINSRLHCDLSEMASKYSCGIVTGVIETEKCWNFQSLWFFNEKGKHVGTERKCNLARYEFSHYGLRSAERFSKSTHMIQGTKGTGIFCWEIHDIRSRVACDEVAPDWVLDAIKFPPNCLTRYVQSKSERILEAIVESQETYMEWLQKLKSLTGDLVTLTIASCGTTFSLCALPKETKPIACIVHPDSNVAETRFQFGPESLMNADKHFSRNAMIERGVFGTLACSNIPGSFVSFDYNDDISLLRRGKKFYESKFGEGTYPSEIAVSVRAWQLRHLGVIHNGQVSRNARTLN